MERKRLRVEGIPTDIPGERAKDKLIIHFLRARNGGGDVEDIQIFSGPPVHAIITFEEEKVVDSVLNNKDHVLTINDKTYHLGVSKVPGKLELDEVFKKSSLSVNYKILPEKLKKCLKGLRETYKEVRFDFDEKSGNCEISGSYTKIQTLSQEIIKNFELGQGSLKEDSANTHSQAETKQSTRKHAEFPVVPQVGDQTSSRQSETKQSTRKHAEFPVVPQVGDQTSSRLYTSAKQESSLSSGATIPIKGESLVQEPFVWDSDIFKYMKKFYSFEYREILNKYNVEAVDESSEEITTIILQTHGDKDCMTNVREAHIKLMGLYQKLEQMLRKEQIDKRDCNDDKNFHRRLLKELKTQFPLLLCHEDDQYLFLIGNGGDVTQGKQYIINKQLTLNNPPSFLQSFDIQTAGGQLSNAAGQSDIMSHSYKHDSYENKGGSKIAAMFNPPTGNGSYMLSQLDKKYPSSSSSNSKQHIDLDPSPGSYKTRGTVNFANSASLNTTEYCSFSQGSEESKGLAQIKKMDVLPALKTGRVEIRQSKSTAKSVEKNKPVRIIASSELAYSSLLDVVPQSVDFKPAEVKLRRSNSFSNVNIRDSSSDQDGTSQMKDEMFMENWLWYYMKVFYKSDIDTLCAEVTLTEETYKESTLLTLKAYSKTKLWTAKQKILLLYKEKRVNLTKSCFQYSSLGGEGPDDRAIKECCSVFRNCSDKLCIKLEKDALLLIFPKVIETQVLEEYSKVLEKKVLEEYDRVLDYKSKYPDTLSLANDGNSSLVTFTKEQENEPGYCGKNENVKYLERNYFKDPEDLKCTEDPKTSRFDGKNNRSTDDKDYSSYFPPLQDENIHKPLQLQETQDYRKSDISLKDPDRLTSKSCNLENHQENVYDSSLAQTMDSFSNLSELRKPAVGQESEPVDRVCDHCKRNGKASTLACSHYVCENCHSAFIDSCCVCCEKKVHGNRNALNATVTYSSMSLSLPGYDRYTSIKVKYEVPDGVQRAEDPQPGKPYKGGTFEAYLPANKEGTNLLLLFEKALKQNLVFQIKPAEEEDVVTWYAIPHKISPAGGKGKNGYPDSQYIRSTIDLLKTLGIE